MNIRMIIEWIINGLICSLMNICESIIKPSDKRSNVWSQIRIPNQDKGEEVNDLRVVFKRYFVLSSENG
jgi:hypothetical protein